MLETTIAPNDSMAIRIIVGAMATRKLNAANANEKRKTEQQIETTTETTTETGAPTAMRTDASTIVTTDKRTNETTMTIKKNNPGTMGNWSARSVVTRAIQ